MGLIQLYSIYIYIYSVYMWDMNINEYFVLGVLKTVVYMDTL